MIKNKTKFHRLIREEEKKKVIVWEFVFTQHIPKSKNS